MSHLVSSLCVSAHVVFAGGVLRRETQLLSGLLEESLGSSLKTGDSMGEVSYLVLTAMGISGGLGLEEENAQGNIVRGYPCPLLCGQGSCQPLSPLHVR